MPQLIADVLGAHLALPLTPADVGFPGPQQPPGYGADVPWQHAATIAAIARLTRSDLMLPHNRTTDDAAQIQAAKALLEPLRRWPSAKPAALRERPLPGSLAPPRSRPSNNSPLLSGMQTTGTAVCSPAGRP